MADLFNRAISCDNRLPRSNPHCQLTLLRLERNHYGRGTLIAKRGLELIQDPSLNKSTAFTEAVRCMLTSKRGRYHSAKAIVKRDRFGFYIYFGVNLCLRFHGAGPHSRRKTREGKLWALFRSAFWSLAAYFSPG
jgi:hypothetical protein